MKIDRVRGTLRAANLAAASYAKRSERAAPPEREPAVVAAVLGIPEAEITPKVREAIMFLMQEVEELRSELAETKKRLESAEKDRDQDHLLPLLNRRAFVRELNRSIAHSARYGTPSSLLYFDLDGFKEINDGYGHAAGDAVLTHFSQMLCAHVRSTDIVGRLGGDEFGVILSHADDRQAKRKAQALGAELRALPAIWKDCPIPTSFSYGAATLKPGENANSALAQADLAMYAHKRQDIRTMAATR